MRINKDKHIGRVLFIVEGRQTEFSILKRIFCNILGYSYIEKRRNRPKYFKSNADRFSKVAVINTRESNIRDISNNTDYVYEVFDVLCNEYDFPVDSSAIYYLFDRDPESNTDIALIEKYIDELSNPYGCNNEGYLRGQLLLSYPSIESYIISNFRENAGTLRFSLGKDMKTYIGENRDIQINKISAESVMRASSEFLGYLKDCNLPCDIDNFSPVSKRIFTLEEADYLSGQGYGLFSMLTLAFLQMGILEMD